jgi:hypothetical protein
MSFEASLFVGFFIIVASIIAVSAMVGGRRRAEQVEELKRQASARGWKFDSVLQKGYRIERWNGTTDGIAWTAESAIHVTGGSHGKRRRHVGRWHGSFSPGINAPIAVMGVPKGKEVITTQIAEGDGFFAKMAQKAVGFAFDKALDVYFGDDLGKEVDAGTMHRIDGQKIPGFIVMAADRDEGARILSQGFEKALVEASNDRASILANDDRPWILLRPNGISLARMEKLRDVAELDGFVKTGVALTRAFKFGRMSV